MYYIFAQTVYDHLYCRVGGIKENNCRNIMYNLLSDYIIILPIYIIYYV